MWTSALDTLNLFVYVYMRCIHVYIFVCVESVLPYRDIRIRRSMYTQWIYKILQVVCTQHVSNSMWLSLTGSMAELMGIDARHSPVEYVYVYVVSAIA